MTRAARIVLCSALLATGGACRTVPHREAVPPVVQVLHRELRLGGVLQQAAVEEMTDTGIAVLEGTDLAFDGWRGIGGTKGPIAVLALPAAGPVARVAAERLRVACGVDVRLAEGAPAGPAPRRVLLVVAPSCADSAPAPLAREAARALVAAGWPAPRAVLLDLVEPRVSGTPWAADELIAARGPREADAAADYVLGARRARTIPDAGELAARHGLPLTFFDWERVSLP